MKWALGASAVLNSILVITVTGALPFFFFLSLTANVALIWYVVAAHREYRELDTDLEDLIRQTFDLEEHLISVHQMEMFYGDPTLQSLIEHTKQVVTDLESYRQKYSLDSRPLLTEEDEEQEEV
jgi:hypothetical protein